mgnify:CR=1 FL=1
MNVRKRGLALLMCICMIFTLLPFSAFADASSDKSVIYGKYVNGTWTQDAEATDTVTCKTEGDNTLSLTKTAKRTADNTYDITLKVVSTQTETTTKPGSAATVLVMDVSGSMDICATCNNSEQHSDLLGNYWYEHSKNCKIGKTRKVQDSETRLKAAKDAACKFILSYSGAVLEDGKVTGLKDNAADGLGRYVSVVSFSDNASVACEWMDVSTVAGYNAAIKAIEGLSAGGGTNFEQGLSKAKSQLDNTTVKDIASKNVIALTDGKPTYWGTNDNGGGNGKECSKAVYTNTKAAATNLKKTGAKLYTVCFGAANEKIKEYDDGKEWYNHTDITVGDFLKNKIATPAAGGKTYAYNADNTTELMTAFKAITSSITEGIKTGTVLDPMGDHITVTSKPDNFVETPTGYKWELSNPTVATDGGKTTYTYELTYTVTFDPNFAEFHENNYYAANGVTTFTAGGEVYYFNVPGVKGTAPRYKVTYEYTGTVPTGAPALPSEASCKAGDTVKVAAAPTLNGYTFSGWTTSDATVGSDGSFTMPSKKVTLTGSWTLRSDLSYTVHYYWNGTTDKVAEDKTVDGQTFNETVTETPVPVNGYTPVSNSAVELKIGTDTNANVITFYYYKNVELVANSATHTFDNTAKTVSGYKAYSTEDTAKETELNITFDGVTATRTETQPGTYDVTFTGTTVGAKDTSDKYIVTKTTDGELTIDPAYQIIYEYKNTPENAPTCPVDNAYYADGTTVSTLQYPGTLEGYIFSGWKINGEGDAVNSVTFDGANIKLIGEWKPVEGLTCTINYWWMGDSEKPMTTKTVDNLTFGQPYSASPETFDGYTVENGDKQTITIKTTGNVINFYYYKNVVLTADSDSATYNGNTHQVKTFKAIVAADRNADIAAQLDDYISALGEGKDAGEYDVLFYRDKEKEVIPVTAIIGRPLADIYYVTDAKTGTLTINLRTVIITSGSASKTYDGTPLTKHESTITGEGFVEGQGVNITYTGSQTEVGSSENTFEYKLKDNTLEKNYTIETVFGTLIVEKRPYRPNPSITDKITVEITGNSDSVVYDGTEHSVKDYTVKISDSRYTEKDFTFSGKALASGVNAGTYEMGLKADQFKNTNARFKNVEFVIKADGVLTITQRPLTITAGSAEGIAPVTCDKYTVEGLATGDKVDSVKITGIQSEPGESPNVASDAVIKNAKGEDVTANYKITYVNGVLKAIEVLNKEIHFNYVIGYTDGTIRPNNDISRAEVATIFFRLLTDEARTQYDKTTSSFSDIKDGAWCCRAVSTLTNMGIIKGYTDGTFRPNADITRAELATIIARFAKLDVNTKTFSDITGHWAQKSIELAAGNGWINGYEDGTFRPNKSIIRAETFAMINRVLDRQTESVSDLLPTSEMNMWSDNLNENAWYYKDVQEATNYHKCDRVGDSVYEKWTEKVPDIDWASYQI